MTLWEANLIDKILDINQILQLEQGQSKLSAHPDWPNPKIIVQSTNQNYDKAIEESVLPRI